MLVVHDFLRIPPFEFVEPERSETGIPAASSPDGARLPMLVSSPHSGTCYPQSFLDQSRLDSQRIRRSEDAFVDRLMAAAPSLGVPLLKVNFPRAFIDVNREPYELDPRMFRGRLPSHANIRSIRVAGGLGTIARVVAENEEIYRHPIPVEEALERIDTFYFPFHDALSARLNRLRARFGEAVLLDCHSMPSNLRIPDCHRRIDVVVGDRYGTSAHPALVDAAVHLLTEIGFSVLRNKPYAGGYITERCGRPDAGFHAIQLEINRGIYMDETHHEPLPVFNDVAALFTTFLTRFIAAIGEILPRRALAAE